MALEQRGPHFAPKQMQTLPVAHRVLIDFRLIFFSERKKEIVKAVGRRGSSHLYKYIVVLLVVYVMAIVTALACKMCFRRYMSGNNVGLAKI